MIFCCRYWKCAYFYLHLYPLYQTNVTSFKKNRPINMSRSKQVCAFVFVTFVFICGFCSHFSLFSFNKTILKSTVAMINISIKTSGFKNFTHTKSLQTNEMTIYRKSSSKRNEPSLLVEEDGKIGKQGRNWEEEKKEIEVEFKDRKKHLREMCQQLNIRQAETAHLGDVVQSRCQTIRSDYGYSECIFTNNFSLARSASSLSCLINKVASTSLVSSMLAADGSVKLPAEVGDSPHMFLAYIVAKTESEFEFARNHFFKFIVVRHPFRRLLSAFKDKVENASHWSLIEFRKDIYDHKKKLNRFQSAQTDGSRSSLTQKDTKRENLIINETQSVRERDRFVPTFEDFLNYILDSDLQGQGYESHWVPFWTRCAPCSLQYDVIAKLEKAPRELRYIWNRMMVRQIPWENKLAATNLRDDDLRAYYSNLSVEVILKVYKRYFLDFMLFNYNIYDVLQLGNHCTKENCHNLLKYYNYLS